MRDFLAMILIVAGWSGAVQLGIHETQRTGSVILGILAAFFTALVAGALFYLIVHRKE